MKCSKFIDFLMMSVIPVVIRPPACFNSCIVIGFLNYQLWNANRPLLVSNTEAEDDDLLGADVRIFVVSIDCNLRANRLP